MLRVTPVFSRIFCGRPILIDLKVGGKRCISSARTAGKNAAQSGSKAVGRRVGGAAKVSGVFALGSAFALCLQHCDVACCDAGPIDPLVSKIKEFANNTVVPWVQEHGFSGVLGFCSGVAIKKVGRSVIAVIGGLILVAQGLQYSGYVDIDYKKIQNDINKKILKQKENGNVQKTVNHVIEKVNSVLLLYVPDTANYVAGVGLGFYLG